MTRRANRRAGGVVLGFKLKLYPNRVKSDLLALLATEFARLHRAALERLGANYPKDAVSMKGLNQRGTGEFAQRATRRAVLDMQRARRALFQSRKLCPYPAPLPYLHAELIDSAEVRASKTKEFDYWIHVEGTGRGNQLNLPARSHAALNRALALPGAKLGVGAEVFRRDGLWYARVSVHVPMSEPTKVREFIGADVGVRAAVSYSDGKQTKGLHLVIRRQRDRQASRQRQSVDRRKHGLSPQCQVLAREARSIVTLAKRTGRGVALEDPSRLIRWRQHAARYFAKRVLLLAGMIGVPVVLVPPPYTSRTCAHCGERDSFRRRRMFRCYACGNTANADVNAARNIAREGTSVYIRAEQAA